MKRSYALFAVIFAVSVLIGIQAVEVVDANPWFTAKEIDPPPGAIPPVISISSPQNNAQYSGNFNISFSVKRAQYSNYHSDIYDVTYTIDNKSVTIPHNGDVLALSQYDTSFVAPNLAAGNHSLIVKATGIVYSFSALFYLDSSSQVYFVTSKNTASIEPTSIPNPTDSPKPTISPTFITTLSPTSNQSIASDYWWNSAAITAIIIGIVILAVASVSLVYLKKHKRNAI